MIKHLSHNFGHYLLCVWLVIYLYNVPRICIYFCNWPEIRDVHIYQGQAIRVLIVSDPHIQTLKGGWDVISWDANRHLAASFREAVKRYRPHVVAFLGDILDAGSRSSVDEFEELVPYYEGIFLDTALKADAKVIAIPGDNDVGGENAEIVTEEKLQQFKQAINLDFDKTTTVDIDFLRVVKLNTFDTEISMDSIGRAQDSNHHSICLTHASIIVDTFRPLEYTEQVLKVLNCHLVFAGHFHDSYISTFRPISPDPRKAISTRELPVTGPRLSLDLTADAMHEIRVPSATYRAGSSIVAYGLLQIFNNGTANYSLIPLPTLTEVLLYNAISVVLFVIGLLFLAHGPKRLYCIARHIIDIVKPFNNI